MFNLNRAPVTAREIERFAGGIAMQLEQRVEPAPQTLVVVVDDGDAMLMLVSYDGPDASMTAQLDQVFAARRRMAAVVSVTGWSPADDVPTRPAWVIVAVGIGGAPACVAVRRVGEGGPLTRLGPRQLPWFALSTASALRAALETGRPLRFKTVASNELYRRPDEVPDPPLDDRGEL